MAHIIENALLGHDTVATLPVWQSSKGVQLKLHIEAATTQEAFERRNATHPQR